jgi:hypothetical protein
MPFFFFLLLLSSFYLPNFIFINLLPFVQPMNGGFFLIAENGCVHAYPPPLGFCVWAFGGGLA